MDKKVTVITGGTAGIGLKIAEVFARAGSNIAICSSNPSNVKRALDDLKKEGISAYGEPVDVSRRSDIFSFADNVEKEFGGIDIWVSNAGICPFYKLVETPEDIWQRVMDVNVKSVYYGGMIAREKFTKRGGGVLIHAASFTTLMPSVGLGAYSVSKAAIYSMTKILAAELAPLNIRVFCYIPGMIETNMTSEIIKERKEVLESQIALKRIGGCEDIANTVLFMASDKASYVTGSYVEISGGKFCVQNPEAAWM
jgi:NAD(P)-dependent dehydrogenase (short-subunit alcohol dehydrogenase family)